MASQEEVVRLLIERRNELSAFILAAVRNHHAAEEVMQEVSVVLCAKASRFQEGSNFMAWAREIARLEVLNYYRRSNRAPAPLSEGDLNQLVEAFESNDAGGLMGDRLEALRKCLARASQSLRELLQLRYEENLPLADIATRVGLAPESVRKSLYRGRLALKDCIDSRIRAVGRRHG